jgi:FdhD protein
MADKNPACAARPLVRLTAGGPPEPSTDLLAVEEPLEIRVKGRAVSVTMRTPGHDPELALGFLLTEGMIARASDVVAVEPCALDRGGNVLNVALAPSATVDFDRLTRHVFASSSCGLCGKATIEAIHQRLEPIPSKPRATVDPTVLLSLPDKLRGAQVAFDKTGGLHAAGLFALDGNLLVAREDVGRHNAVDKVLGYALTHDLLPLGQHVLMVSGRASFEILQKALAGRIPVIAAVSAPSSLAVDFAKESNQTLVGFVRGQRMNLYAGGERICQATPPLSPVLRGEAG